jgi:hypothetical protein
MSQEVDLRAVERKAYLAYHQDGIYDLLIGLCFMGMALGVVTEAFTLAAIAPVLAILIAPGVKKAVTLPRLGYVKFSPQREWKEQTNRQRLVVLMTVTALLGVLVSFGYSGDAAWQLWIRSLGIIPFGLVLAVVAFALGLLYDIRRCYVYAAVILVTFIVGHLLELRLWLQFGLPGIVIFVVGLVLFIRLVSRYPKAPAEETHEA